ncbi:MAG: YjjG family noncanonical pyrimidine nucleotidase [Clostridia bacterium]|nr:YjjG family noncanonical pyrimidine nucleotidase [Clostridia bacterium]
MYKYILMDNDGTLMDFEKAKRESVKMSWNMLGMEKEFTEEIQQTYDKINDKWWLMLEKGEVTRDELETGRFADFFEKVGVVADPQKMMELYEENISHMKFILDGATETMKKLSEKYEIYIITNGFSNIQHGRLDDCEFTPYFRKMYVSGDIGLVKPDKAYFDYVMKDIGDMDKSAYLVVGDSLSSDILGAKNAGMDCAWVHPKGKVTDLPIKYHIESVKELTEILL